MSSQFDDSAESTSEIHKHILLNNRYIAYQHRLSIAPTVLQFSGNIFMAVDKHCMVSGGTIDHPIDDHQVLAFDDESSVSTELRDLVKAFIKELVPARKYLIVLYKTEALFGHNHVLPTLIAVWQLVRSFEREIWDDRDLDYVLRCFLREHMYCGVEMNFEKHIFEAILQGSLSHVHIRSHIPPINENIEYFFDSSKTEIIFLFVSRFEPSQIQISDHARPCFQTKRSIQDFVQRNSRWRPLHKMMQDDKKQLKVTRMEMELDAAMNHFFDLEENQRFNAGFDVQKEGVMMVVPKGTFENNRFLKNISDSIQRECSEIPRMVTFDLLVPTKGVNVFVKENFSNMSSNRKRFVWKGS